MKLEKILLGQTQIFAKPHLGGLHHQYVRIWFSIRTPGRICRWTKPRQFRAKFKVSAGSSQNLISADCITIRSHLIYDKDTVFGFLRKSAPRSIAGGFPADEAHRSVLGGREWASFRI